MKVIAGQIWRHKPSGDVRTVLAVMTYRDRAGCDPSDFDRAYGVTHIAAMSVTDRRDSSDMELVNGERPRRGDDWELLTDTIPPHDASHGQRASDCTVCEAAAMRAVNPK